MKGKEVRENQTSLLSKTLHKILPESEIFYQSVLTLRVGYGKIEKIFSQARDLAPMQLTRVLNDDSKLRAESKLACSKGEL
jgi:hypothetical protein